MSGAGPIASPAGTRDGDPILEGLNGPQREAVLANQGPVLILAGAGSGKTRALTRKIAYLVKREGVAPWEILAVTFTNKAAQEMRHRCGKLLGEDVEMPWLGTFHRVGVRLLRRHGELVGVPDHFVIYDQSDQRAMAARCLKALKMDKIRPQGLQAFIEDAKRRGLRPEELGAADSLPDDDRMLRLYRAYDAEMKKAGAVDFSDLLMLPLRMVQAHPEIASEYKRRWRFVLVDEFQDTNRIQYELLLATLNDEQRLCVVGDDDQSIYRWRGADVANILRFPERFPKATVIRLEQNYRSTERILDAASSMIARNTARHPKRLWTELGPGEHVVVRGTPTDLAEASFVVERAARLRREVPLGEIAVFYRTNAQSRPFEDALRRASIPYRVVGGLRFYDRAEVKDLLAYLKVLMNPGDAVSLERIVNNPPRGIGATTVEAMRDYARTHQTTLWDATCALAQRGTGAQQKKLGPFLELMAGLQDLGRDASALTIAHEALTRSGYLGRLESEDSAEADARIQNLQELLNAIEEFGQASADHRLASFLEQVALVTDLDTADWSGEALTLMTAHGAKGLEFDAVFVTGLEYGLWPHVNAMDEALGVEEERRLAYVAMTRARKHLWLTHAGQRRRFGTLEAAMPSPLLDDLPPEAVLRKGPSTARAPFAKTMPYQRPPGHPAQPPTRRRKRTAPLATEDMSQEAVFLDEGSTVFHPSFGEGRVLTLDGQGRDAKARVLFDDGGERRILARFLTLVG